MSLMQGCRWRQFVHTADARDIQISQPRDHTMHPRGEYRVKAKVSDLNANVSFELETKFRLE
jgi:hypothetical protein